MTDLEVLRGALTQMGVSFTEDAENYNLKPGEAAVVYLDEGTGYRGFFVLFFFDKEGRFVRYGVWE